MNYPNLYIKKILRRFLNLQPDHNIGLIFQQQAGERYLDNFCNAGQDLGEYYWRFGEPIQTWDHVIQSCPTYERHHIALCEELQTLYLPDRLNTKDSIKAIVSFLEKFGASQKMATPLRYTLHPTHHSWAPYRFHRGWISNSQPTWIITLSSSFTLPINTCEHIHFQPT